MTTEDKLTITPITPAVGAIASGVDLSRTLRDAELGAIRKAVLEKGAVFFRDQHITQPQAVSFLRQFGPLSIDPFSKAARQPAYAARA